MYFVIICPPWKKLGPFICTNLNLLHPRMLCAQWFWWSRFLNFVNIFSLFCYYLPSIKGVVLFNNKTMDKGQNFCQFITSYWLVINKEDTPLNWNNNRRYTYCRIQTNTCTRMIKMMLPMSLAFSMCISNSAKKFSI